jgi:hypothetical protein
VSRDTSITAGARIPALLVVLATEVPAGARVWGWQEPGTEDAVLCAEPFVSKDGSNLAFLDRGLVSLGPTDVDHDGLILIEEIS